MKDQNKKEEVSKTTPTEPTPSESTKTFQKRVVVDYFYSTTKYSMSSKDWDAAFKDLNQMMSADGKINLNLILWRKEPYQ